MSIQTNIAFLNANDPDFIKAVTGTPEELEDWEDEWGNVSDRPGGNVICDNIADETGDEYGGIKVRLADIPPHVTHIVIYNS